MRYAVSRLRLQGAVLLCLLISGASCALAGDDTADSLGEFFTGGKFDGKARAYYLNRHFSRPHTDESLAVGGWLDYETALFYGLGAGAVVYTSQGLGIFTDPDRDGASLLAPGQHSYTVLGQAFLKAQLSETRAKVFRQELDTPMINPYDCKMTPKTVEAYTIESRDIPYLSVLASHVTKIKGWTDSSFTSMSEYAGFEDTSEPVTLAGLTFTPLDALEVQIWEYYAHEFMNIVYFQADGSLPLRPELKLIGSVQAIDQRDVGRAIGGEFSTGMGGIKTGVNWGGATLATGYTITSGSHDIVNPWGSYPGFTSIMEEDCDLAGEKAWLASLKYDFEHVGMRGLSAFFDYTHSRSPDTETDSSPFQNEYNLTVDYKFAGRLDGLWLRLRAAQVDNSKSTDGEDYSDYRIIINYDFSVF